jgi:hypothetical protein
MAFGIDAGKERYFIMGKLCARMYNQEKKSGGF